MAPVGAAEQECLLVEVAAVAVPGDAIPLVVAAAIAALVLQAAVMEAAVDLVAEPAVVGAALLVAVTNSVASWAHGVASQSPRPAYVAWALA